MIEVFQTKKDTKLLGSQLGRLMLPNVLAENSRHWIVPAPARAASDNIASPPDPEPLLNWCNKLLCAPPSPTRAPPDCAEIVLSPFSRVSLPRLRALCRSRGIRFHVLACPSSEQ